jgi:hypothetical protein
VQIFASENLDVDGLQKQPDTGLENLVLQFLAKNKGVFQYLFNQQSKS